METTADGTAHYHLYIDGKWENASAGEMFERVSPADGEVVAVFERGDESDVSRAVRVARRAFDEGEWPGWAGKERAEVLRRTADILRERRGELARLESRQSGMLIGLAHTTIDWCIELYDVYAGLARQLSGRFYHHSPTRMGLVVPEPLGVVGLISPWNFPLSEMVWKIAPALAAGCTIVAKPPSLTPITILELADILAEAGLPSGVYNVVTGPGSTVGQALVDHPDVDLISLTGDTITGQEIMRRAAAHTKRLTLELGGKSPNIVFADADLDRAVEGVISAIFYRTGQVCTAGSRLIIEERVHDEFMDRLVAIARDFRVGDPMDPETQMGPLISESQMKSVLAYIEQGKNEGAALAVGGDRLARAPYDRGCYVLPTIFDRVDPEMTIAREEIFGPVLTTFTFKDDREAIQMANDTRYGLAGAVWTRDIGRALQVARAVRAGTFWINQYGTIELEMPFGGFKESGFGRELGMESVEAFTEPKSIHIQI
jgi:acyl-CoA reductase-like NAD-dependent aldehyde dehydrogenase